MKITLDIPGLSVEIERQPMPPERFKALCRIVYAVVAGAVAIVAIALLGIPGLFTVVLGWLIGLIALAAKI